MTTSELTTNTEPAWAKSVRWSPASRAALEELNRREVILAFDMRSRDVYAIDPEALRVFEDDLTDLGPRRPLSLRPRLINMVPWPTPRLSGITL